MPFNSRMNKLLYDYIYVKKHMHVAQSLSCIQLFPTPQAVAGQAPLSMEFSRQESWSGLPFPPPGDPPDPSFPFSPHH